MLTKEMMRESLAVQEWLEEGREEGREQGLEKGLEKGIGLGLEKGRLIEARDGLLRFIAYRFPGLAVRDAVEAIQDLTHLRAVTQEVFDARTAAAVRRAIGKSPGSGRTK